MIFPRSISITSCHISSISILNIIFVNQFKKSKFLDHKIIHIIYIIIIIIIIIIIHFRQRELCPCWASIRRSVASSASIAPGGIMRQWSWLLEKGTKGLHARSELHASVRCVLSTSQRTYKSCSRSGVWAHGIARLQSSVRKRQPPVRRQAW